jgi:hypothetical protein
MADSEVNRRKILKGAAAGSLAVAAAAAAGVAHAQPSTTASPTPSGTPTPSATPTAPGTTTPSQTTTPAPSATPSTSAAPLTTASAPGQNRVAILGGGPAGLTAAHELAERGFHVTVYERRGWGGKARSMDTPLPVAGGRKPLPGEHGFRFFPGYYRCIPDTMSRIPFEGNKNGVRDNLVPAPTVTGEQKGGNITIPFGFSTGDVATAANLEWLVNTLAGGMYWIPKLPYGDLITFAKRLLVYFTSCDDRRNQGGRRRRSRSSRRSSRAPTRITSCSSPRWPERWSRPTRTSRVRRRSAGRARTSYSTCWAATTVACIPTTS